MSVRIDEAGRHHAIGGVDGPPRGDPGELADLRDLPAGHRHIRMAAGPAGAVDHEAVLDQEIHRHDRLLLEGMGDRSYPCAPAMLRQRRAASSRAARVSGPLFTQAIAVSSWASVEVPTSTVDIASLANENLIAASIRLRA